MPISFAHLMFQDALPIPTIIDATAGGTFDFDVIPAKCDLHSSIPAAGNNCWTVVRAGTVSAGATVASYLGPVIVAKQNKAITVHWTNKTNTKGAAQQPPPINIIRPFLTMMPDRWEAPKGLTMHLHGAKVLGHSDGWPLAEKLPGETQTCCYPNKQSANLIWYHDHAMDWTARIVHAGIAGGYLIRDSFDNKLMTEVGPNNEIPLVFQDRQLWNPELNTLTSEMRYEISDPVSTRPASYGVDMNGISGQISVIPEHIGEFNLVNAKLWPKHVLPARDLYRLRMINGCNARTYAFKLLAQKNGQWQFVTNLMTVIGTDGGFLGAPIPVPANDALIMAPGERRDVILDARYLDGYDVQNGYVQLFVVNVAGVPFASNALSAPLDNNPNSVLNNAATVANADFIQSIQAFPQVMRFDINMQTAARLHPGFLSIKLPSILIQARAANTEFKYLSAFGWRPRWGVNFGPNRLFLIDNQTGTMQVNGQAVGMMYLRECHQVADLAIADLIVPLSVDTTTLTNPAAASLAGAQIGYQYDHRMQHHGMDPAMDDTFEQVLITQAPKPGTYERWYFVNLEPADAAQAAQSEVPDMHPIHLHLVNFYLARAWQVSAPNNAPVVPQSNNKQMLAINLGLYAKLGLRDTIRVAGLQIVEFIAYFPSGFTQASQPFPAAINRYPFHCHILEHEEMGMMRYFDYN